MDARFRINQIRKNKKRGGNFNKKRGNNAGVSDLRQLINSSEPRGSSIKNRIGFVSKSKQHEKINKFTGNKIQKAKNRKISLVGAKRELPKVTVKVGGNFNKGDFNRGKRGNRVNLNKAQPRVNINDDSKSLVARHLRESASTSSSSSSSSQQIVLPQVNQPFGTVPVIIMPAANYVSEPMGSTTLAMDNERRKPVTARLSNSNSNTSVLITNLKKTITLSDIEELFGEIGPLVSAAMINPTMAIVTYDSYNDAVLACQTYHNRLLDGFPMQCNVMPNTNTIQSASDQNSFSQNSRRSNIYR